MFYDHNTISQSRAVIFVHCCIVDEAFSRYKDATKKGEVARKLLEEELEFDKVEVCTDYPKNEIIDKFDELDEDAKEFEFYFHFQG